jgi:hypothetical protein
VESAVSKEFGGFLWTRYLLETCAARILGIVALELVKRLAPLTRPRQIGGLQGTQVRRVVLGGRSCRLIFPAFL